MITVRVLKLALDVHIIAGKALHDMLKFTLMSNSTILKV